MPAEKPKVLFTFVEAGMGHIMPMTGMLDAFAKKYGDKCEIIKSYVFSESGSEKVRKMGKELSDHTKRLASNFLYNKLEAASYLLSSRLTLKFLDAHFGKAKDLYIEDFRKINPDLTVSTFYLPAHLARLSNERGFTKTLIATYTPDPYIYPAWDRKCDLFIVNNHTAYEMALKKGFAKEKVKEIPFIYKKEIIDFSLGKESAKKELGIKDGKLTVLFTGGAYGAKGTEKLISKILAANLEINLVVVCGKAKELYDNMVKAEKNKGENTDFYVVGFTDKLAEYMCASDVIIGKSGMNTLMEAAYFARPMIINAEANRLEEKISEFGVKEKIVVKEKKADNIVKILRECLSDREKFTKRFGNYENFNKFKNVRGGGSGSRGRSVRVAENPLSSSELSNARRLAERQNPDVSAKIGRAA